MQLPEVPVGVTVYVTVVALILELLTRVLLSVLADWLLVLSPVVCELSEASQV